MNAPMLQQRFWNASQAKLRCVAIVPEAPDVKTFHFAAADESWFLYKPGQFVTLALPVPGNPVHRTYTLSSTPTRPQRASVTVKAQKDSIGTRWLLDHFRVGDSLSAVGPAGDFTLPASPKKLLFVSGGSGITPMLSMTRYLHDLAADVDITFLHFARTPEDLLFQVMLDWGVDLALPIAKQAIQGKDVFLVDGNALAACFDGHGGVDEEFVKELAKVQPLRVVFRDAGFKDSSVKINVEQIFKLLSPATEVKCI